MTDEDSPKQSAASLYEQLVGDRQGFLDRAREASALTIPMLIPRNGTVRGTVRFDCPRQGLGARGVNHLSSRLLLALFPTNVPFFKLDMDRFAAAKLAGADQAVQVEVAKTLSMIEDSVQREVDAKALRVPSAEMFKHLIVAGNVCQYLTNKGGMQYYPISQYVCTRDAEGDQLVDLVIQECVARRSLPKDVQAQAKLAQASGADGKYRESNVATSGDVTIYTQVSLEEGGMYKVEQQLADGSVIEGTQGTFTAENLPYRPIRWTKVSGEAYGRGLVEEHQGDLMSLELLSGALVDGAVAAARVIGLCAPNGVTHPKDINDAKNGEFVVGAEADIKFLQLNKFADFSTAEKSSESISHRLEQAFLLNAGAIRNAERVTAEEVRFAAQELESTLGGVYSILAAEFQLPLVRSILARLQAARLVPSFPGKLKKSIVPVIITGVEALGRTTALDNLRIAFGTVTAIVGPEEAARRINIGALITYAMSQASVKIDGITKPEAQVQAEMAQQQQQEAAMLAVKHGVGPAVNAVSAATQQQNAQAAPAGGAQ